MSVILPALNEEEAIPHVVRDLRTHLPADGEIIVVDDGSTDATAEIAEQLGVIVCRHENNQGKGAAMSTGVAAATGNRLVFMDADATYPAAAVPRLVRELDEHDIVRGERPLSSENIPRVNRLGNRVFNRLLASFHQLEGEDLMSGLYAMTREAYKRLGLESAGFDIEVEIGIKAKQRGLRLGTVSIDYHPRIGSKKLRPVRDGVNIMMRAAGIAILYSPTVTFIIPGLLMVILGFLGAVLLSGGPLVIGSIGLSINSLVLASIAALGGFQLVVFGIAALLYRTETGSPAKRWLLLLVQRPVRLGAALTGVLLSLGGAIWLLNLVLTWIGEGAGDFLDTGSLVLSASMFVFGLQLMSAGLFLSIFSGRLAARNGR
jgi:hypothetical protein